MSTSDPTGQVGQPTTFVVDYDLPADHTRKRFYRAVQRYLRERMIEDTGWSTYSVVFTGDQEFAFFVYNEALKVGGRANIYVAHRLDTLERAVLSIRTEGGE